MNVDTLKQPLFLGEDLSLQRYDKFKYPVFFDVSFTRKAENLVCKNVEIIGNVIFVILSKHSILGITVSASRSNDNK